MSAPRIGEKWQDILRALPPNWNSYGSVPISETAIAALEQFCAVPMSDGGIQLEAHIAGVDFEIEIRPDGKIRGISYGGLA